MRILVTGATGFIGNYVINELLDRGVKVVATGRSIEKARNFDWFSKVIFVPYDFENETIEDFSTFFHNPDNVIHLAWSGLPNYAQLFHFEKELPQQYSFLKKLISAGIRDITITGTCFEYGMQEGQLNEEFIANPANPYSFAKDSLRRQLEFLKGTTSFELKWVRLFYMYGKGQSSSSILSQLQKALDEKASAFNMSQGDQLRDYLPVEEVAKNIVTIALQSKVFGIINCCSGKPISVKKLVDEYLKKQNKIIKLNLGFYPYPTYEPFAFWGDNSKLKKIYLNESN